MLHKKLTIVNKLGLHARASMQLINHATRFQSDIIIEYNGRQVNAKSIMNVMVLAAAKGAEIDLIIEGDDEAAAMEDLEKLIHNKFGEEE